MAEPLDSILDALAAYWSSPLTLSILAVCATAMGTLLYVFLSNARNARLRVSLLTGFYGLTVFFWTYVAASLVFCVMSSDRVAYTTMGVREAAALAVLLALGTSLVLSYMVWRFGAPRVLARLAPRSPRPEEVWITDYVALLSKFEGLRSVPVLVVERGAPIAMAVGGRRPAVLVSRRLLDLLDREEVETVLAHELMHLKHHDAEFKVFSTVFSRILIFDPFSKFFDPAVHREREYLADEMSGRSTGHPAALASALLKLARHGPPPRATWGLSVYGSGQGLFSRYPPLQERVQRLFLLSDLLSGPEEARGKV